MAPGRIHDGAGAAAYVNGSCTESGVTFEATLVNVRDPEDSLGFQTSRYAPGIVGQRRINDENATAWVFSRVKWSNQIEVASLSFEHNDPVSAETTWRVLGQIETSAGAVLIKIPTFDANVQKMIVECKKKLDRTARRPQRVGG
jgi:hypothetical protein